jgi:cob(I)alamin adenosyltransferase
MQGKRFSQGMIQVYTGNGKGKTTAALGLACRAAGHGFATYIIQFMKGNIEYGELETVKKLAPYVTIKQMGRECFVRREKPDVEDIKLAHDAMELAQEVILGGKYDIVVLDEINVAVEFGLVPTQDVLALMDKRPAQVELILTGRYAAPEVIDRADLVTEMIEVKHYYHHGIESRAGIEL